jgi:uncharacterized protein YjiS (DUF1127 family)
MRTHAFPFPAAAPRAAASSARQVASLFQSVLDAILMWQDRERQRRALAGMSDHMLRDIGVSRADAVRESVKPFWRP